MGKVLYIAEKPSVARQFADALKIRGGRRDGYLESDDAVVTWCVGHLVTMSYPEAYDPALKKWSMDTLPFIPESYRYEVIEAVSKQFEIVRGLLTREDVDVIYVCTDSGREGEYIYRLVDMMAHVGNKPKKRVWIDSQTEDEILRGIREARDLSEYDNLSASAYLRAIEDYLIGINFSRVLTLKYGSSISSFLNTKYSVISVGRVMTCVLGMVVRREREIRNFIKTPFYRVLQRTEVGTGTLECEWKAVEGSRYYGSPLLYKENGLKKREDAEGMIQSLLPDKPGICIVSSVSSKTEKKNPPLLFNLAELQNECSKRFKISPDETLAAVQELYEKKLVTYPRTDARVLSTAVAGEIYKNLKGLCAYTPLAGHASEILEKGKWRSISKTKYVNDSQITDHYAIIPTGQGLGALRSLKERGSAIYDLIVRRFLAAFMDPAIFRKISLETVMDTEHFFSVNKVLTEKGYLILYPKNSSVNDTPGEGEAENNVDDSVLMCLSKLKKGDELTVSELLVKEGETSPPKRYNSGSLILAMENAGQLIEDEDLRAQIKGSGIGTSATRAEILKKLITIKYLGLNKKTQIISPTLNGEMVYDVVDNSIRSLLNPELTASWEKGLTYVTEGTITDKEYMEKMDGFVRRRVEAVRNLNNQSQMRNLYIKASQYYKK